MARSKTKMSLRTELVIHQNNYKKRHFTVYCDDCKDVIVPRFYAVDNIASQICQESFEVSDHITEGTFVRIYCEETKEYIRVEVRKGPGGISLRKPQVFKGAFTDWR